MIRTLKLFHMITTEDKQRHGTNKVHTFLVIFITDAQKLLFCPSDRSKSATFNCCIVYMTGINHHIVSDLVSLNPENEKVLLRDRKRHTARGLTSLVLLLGAIPCSVWWGVPCPVWGAIPYPVGGEGGYSQSGQGVPPRQDRG